MLAMFVPLKKADVIFGTHGFISSLVYSLHSVHGYLLTSLLQGISNIRSRIVYLLISDHVTLFVQKLMFLAPPESEPEE